MCSGRGRRLWVLSHRVMVPSALGMFLCAFPFGHVRPLDAVLAAVRGRGLAPRGRTSPWRSVRTRLFSVPGPSGQPFEPQPYAPT